MPLVPAPATPADAADRKALWRKVVPEACTCLVALCLALGLYPALLDIAPQETLDAYFALCAFDGWRAHQPAFARAPRPLWRRTPFEEEITLLSSF